MNQTPPKTTDIDRDLSREEITLAEFPITTMALKRPAVTEWPVQEVVGRDPDGKPIYRSWTIVGSEKYGLPIASDEDIYVAIGKLVEHHNFTQTLIPCTRYQICQLLGVPPDGRVYQRLSDAFTRLSLTKFVAENVFRRPEDGALIAREVFGIIDSFRFVDAVPRGAARRQQELPLSYIRVSEEFLRRLREGNIKRLDTAFWRSLPSYLTKRLFRFLDKNRYRKTQYSIGVRKLADKLGLAKSNPERELKRVLKGPLDELKTRGFLSAYRFSKAADGGWKVEIAFNANFEPYKRATAPEAPDTEEGAESRSEGQIQGLKRALDPAVLAARELVAYFREVFHGSTGGRMGQADLARAASLLDRCHGDLERAKFCVSWTRKEAERTNFYIQSFGGLLINNYPDRALAQYEEHQRRAEADAAYSRRLGLENRYAIWLEDQRSKRWTALSPEERKAQIADVMPHVREKFGSYLQTVSPDLIERTAERWVRDRLGSDLPDFEAWCTAAGAGSAPTSEGS